MDNKDLVKNFPKKESLQAEIDALYVKQSYLQDKIDKLQGKLEVLYELEYDLKDVAEVRDGIAIAVREYKGSKVKHKYRIYNSPRVKVWAVGDEYSDRDLTIFPHHTNMNGSKAKRMRWIICRDSYGEGVTFGQEHFVNFADALELAKDWVTTQKEPDPSKFREINKLTSKVKSKGKAKSAPRTKTVRKSKTVNRHSVNHIYSRDELNKKTVAQLRKIASRLQMPGIRMATKAELVNYLAELAK